jgi:molybdate transport system regulatory protein
MDKVKKKIRFNYKVWLETEDGQGIFGYGQMRLLKAIDQTGTLKTATDQTGLNYQKSWSKLKEIEDILGFKIIRTCKIDGHKVTKLTEEGKQLVISINEFASEYEKLIERACAEATVKLLKNISEK